jgi:hypothetical protein
MKVVRSCPSGGAVAAGLLCQAGVAVAIIRTNIASASWVPAIVWLSRQYAGDAVERLRDPGCLGGPRRWRQKGPESAASTQSARGLFRSVAKVLSDAGESEWSRSC